MPPGALPYQLCCLACNIPNLSDAAPTTAALRRDPKSNPDGWIPLVVAENKLNNAEVLARLQEGSKDAPEWVMNYGRCAADGAAVGAAAAAAEQCGRPLRLRLPGCRRCCNARRPRLGGRGCTSGLRHHGITSPLVLPCSMKGVPELQAVMARLLERFVAPGFSVDPSKLCISSGECTELQVQCNRAPLLTPCTASLQLVGSPVLLEHLLPTRCAAWVILLIDTELPCCSLQAAPPSLTT